MFSSAGCDALTIPVTKEEVRIVVMSMQSFKALGREGFQPFFFKHYWGLVGDEVWNLVKEAFLWGKIKPKKLLLF